MGWDGPATWRQLETWKAWLKKQWNEPSRADHYLMQVAAEIRRGNLEAKDAKRVQDDHFKIKFTEREVKRTDDSPPLSPAERSATSRAIWGAAIHGKRPKETSS